MRFETGRDGWVDFLGVVEESRVEKFELLFLVW